MFDLAAVRERNLEEEGVPDRARKAGRRICVSVLIVQRAPGVVFCQCRMIWPMPWDIYYNIRQ